MTGVTPGNSAATSVKAWRNTGKRRGASLRRLPGISTTTGASGDSPWRARNRAPSPVSAPDSSTGWPTKRAGSPWLAK